MTAPQCFPLPQELSALARETVSCRVSRLPFLRKGVMVTGELVGIAMECLNAESTRTLPLRTPPGAAGSLNEGLDWYIEQRLGVPGKAIVPVIADVLCSAGIAQPAEILDRYSRKKKKGIRLCPEWSWHIASAPVQPGDAGEYAASPFSWMSLCPVCRAGALHRVAGKQLFGIPRTGYYAECTRCGAKFIPAGNQFRLVSIATIRDPLWKRLLDKTCPADTWAAIARKTGGGESRRIPEKPVHNSPPAPIAPGLVKLKDGSVAVPCETHTVYFRQVKLRFSGGIRGDIFSRAQGTLQEVIDTPAYSHLKEAVTGRYSAYLRMRIGLFLSQLKERHDPFYLEFLNRWGDERYGTFAMEECTEAEKKGVFVIVAGGQIDEAGCCHTSFRAMINEELGRITPKSCLLDNDGMRCRVNSLVSKKKNKAEMFVHCSDDREACLRLAGVIKNNSLCMNR